MRLQTDNEATDAQADLNFRSVYMQSCQKYCVLHIYVNVLIPIKLIVQPVGGEGHLG